MIKKITIVLNFIGLFFLTGSVFLESIAKSIFDKKSLSISSVGKPDGPTAIFYTTDFSTFNVSFIIIFSIIFILNIITLTKFTYIKEKY